MGCCSEAALAVAESDDQATAREAIGQLGQFGATPATAIVARRLRERGVRGVTADRDQQRAGTPPA